MKHPPSAGFFSPSGGAVPVAPPLGRLRRPFEKPPPKKRNWGARGRPTRSSSLRPVYEDSEYILGFKIGQRESGFYSERTESQTDRITEPSSTVLVASEESFLLSHMTDPKNAIKSLILVVEQFCIKHFLILFQF